MRNYPAIMHNVPKMMNLKFRGRIVLKGPQTLQNNGQFVRYKTFEPRLFRVAILQQQGP